jgi:tRNA nucleotidyltransferase (CCA-adding enzyme)
MDPATWQAILVSAPHLGRLSPERVQQEIVKTMSQVALPSIAFRLWRDSGAFAELIPALAGITDVQLLALDHLRRPLLARRPQRLQTRLAGLFSATRSGTVIPTLKALRFSNADVAWIAGLVDRWHDMGRSMTHELMGPAAPTDAVLRSWAGRTGRTRLAPVLRIADAHWWAQREVGKPAPGSARVESVYRRAVRIAYRDPVEVSDLAVNGDDLLKVGITGRRLGDALRSLLQYVLEDPARNTRDDLLRHAEELS